MPASEILSVPYWDVFPKKIRLGKSSVVTIPLSIRGTPPGELVYETVNGEVASVDASGRVTAGQKAGATMVMIYDSWDRRSVRHVQVEVKDYEPAATGGGY